MATYAKVIGLPKLRKKLEAFVSVGKEEIKKAMETSADEIVAMAKRLVPVDKGDLKDSIGWTWGKAPKGSMSLGKVQTDAVESGFTITIYAGNSEAYYSRWVEFGTQKMRDQPYFYPAYRAMRKSAKSRVTRAITKTAKKVASQ
ncbi:HK97-gp10 family putative phage morphogenesis protein [Brucella anthropi]|uniref:HK97-gp10 family putative phage morphogenesis protein n=1 Tax=Brucella anthropi TaxID=529 RepID=UPI00244B99F5|nr:HK97-gp10 family putative phage morphogenesis protein [Brucella anthropi]MDH0367977.1 HK97 gp10 family phage protein [Brucella anthropi]